MITSEHRKQERSGRHSKRLAAVLLETVNMPAKDEPLPHRYFDHPLGGQWNDHRGWARIRRLPKSVIPGRPAGAGPEPMNTCNSNGLVVLCSWVPDSRAAPALRNDRSFGTSCPASPRLPHPARPRSDPAKPDDTSLELVRLGSHSELGLQRAAVAEFRNGRVLEKACRKKAD
jgi:mRNA-degrading endonuclease YafQ of YafQ-DinJ toxin-antitoxin module